MSMRFFRTVCVVMILSGLTACATAPTTRDGPPQFSVNVDKIPNAKPVRLAKSKYGNPPFYTVRGKRYYVLKTAAGYDQRGIASWYGTKFDGHLTSTRESYSLLGMTAASPVLPLPTFVRVTNLQNGKEVIVKVNDRGPFAPHRIIDLSYVAARKLGYYGKGTAMVEVAAINLDHPNAAPFYPKMGHPLFLQLGAFSARSNAEYLKSRVSHYTQEPVIVAMLHTEGRHLFKVQVGPFKEGSIESKHLQNRLEEAGLGHAISIVG